MHPVPQKKYKLMFSGSRLMLPIVLLGLTAVASVGAAVRPPNFVFFLTDDQPYLGMSAPAIRC